MRGRCDRVDEEFVNARLVADLQEHIYGAVEVHVYVVEVAYAARRLVRYFIRVYMCMAVYYHFFTSPMCLSYFMRVSLPLTAW